MRSGLRAQNGENGMKIAELIRLCEYRVRLFFISVQRLRLSVCRSVGACRICESRAATNFMRARENRSKQK